MNKYAILHFDDGYAERGSILVKYKKKVKIEYGQPGYKFYEKRLKGITHLGKSGNIRLLFKDDFWAWDGGSGLSIVNVFGIDIGDKEFEAEDDETAELIFEVENE